MATGTAVHPPQSKYPSLGVELFPGTAVHPSFYGLFCCLSAKYSRNGHEQGPGASQWPQEVISGSRAGTLSVVKQFPLLEDGLHSRAWYNYDGVKRSLHG